MFYKERIFQSKKSMNQLKKKKKKKTPVYELDRAYYFDTSYGVYISQLIRFARASSNLNDLNYRYKALTAKLLRQGYRYFKLRKAFSKFYRRHSALLEKYSVSLKTLLQHGISERKFYGDLVYRFRKIVGKSNFLGQFQKTY